MAIHVELSDDVEKIVREAMESGRYKTVEEFLGTAAYVLRERDAQEHEAEEFYKAIDEGFASGPGEAPAFEQARQTIRDAAAKREQRIAEERKKAS